MVNNLHKALVLLNAVGFAVALIWWYKAPGWEPAVTSIALLSTLVGVLVKGVPKADSGITTGKATTSDTQQSQKPTSSTEEKEKSEHIIDYMVAEQFDPKVTPEELNILRRFSRFPRSQYTQGYRLDWIYKELLNDLPASTSHLILESLASKGHLERWTTKQGNTYYRISDDGGKFLIDNRLIEIPKV